MIKGLVLVLLLGVAAGNPLTFLNFPIKPGFCHNPPVQSGLDSDKFFKNKWYIWKNNGAFFLGTSGSCSATQSKIDGENINLLYYQYEPMLNRFLSIEGKTQKIFTSFKGLMFPVQYHAFNRFKFSLPLSVVDTDYDNWAVMYFCKQMFLTKIEMTWIMVRDKDAALPESELSEVRRSVAAVEADLEDFQSQDNSKCGDREPHL